MLMRRIILTASGLALVAFVAVALFGQPSSAYGAWASYKSLLAAGHYARAAGLVSTAQLEREDHHRRLALEASEAELAKLDFLDMAAVLGIRKAVHVGSLSLEDVQDPANPRAFHAALRKGLPNQPLQKFSLLAAVPLGPGKSTGWVGPEEFGLKTLPFSVAFGLRIDFEYQDGKWRLDYFPAMSASARENEAIGGTGSQTDFAARKRYFSMMLAADDTELQTALWHPLDSQD